MPAQPGQMLSHYRLVEKIGEGGMGVVWKAEDAVLNRTVAIKVLPADVSRNEKRREMFLAEARLASSVSDAHIVEVHEFGRAGDLDFIVMEYVEGKPVSEILHGRPLPAYQVADFGYQVARALSRAHRKKLLHRDLKPGNILVSPDGDVKVVDFGLATLFTSDATLDAEAPTRSVAPGGATGQGVSARRAVAGTLHYMSPEQVQGEKLDARSDIFSLGVVLYEMTTGQRPFMGATAGEVVTEIERARPKPVHDLVPKVPLDLDRIIQKSLAPRCADRYQNMEDLAVDLKRLGRDLETGSSPSYQDLEKSPKPLRRRKIAGVALVVAVGLLGGALFYALQGTWPPWAGESQPEERAVAVIGFENLSDPDDSEHLGRVLMGLITTDLAETGGVSVVSMPKVLAALRRVSPSEVGGFDVSVAPDAARRAGAQVMLVGQVAGAGDRLILTAELIDVESGRTLGSHQEEAGSASELFALAGGVATEVRNRLGISSERLSLRPFDLARALTASPEAYRHFAAGEIAFHEQRWTDAMDRFERAIAKDPTFALAYYRLALVRWWKRGTPGIITSLQEGLRYVERLPERWQIVYRAFHDYLQERYDISYEALIRLVRSSPDIPDAYYLLGELAVHAGRYRDPKKAREFFERALEIDPTFTVVFFHLFETYVQGDNIEGAERLLARYREENPNDPGLLGAEVQVMMARGSFNAAAARAEDLMDHAGFEDKLIECHLLAGHWERAYEIADEGIRTGVGNERAVRFAYRGLSQLGRGQLRAGISDSRRAAATLEGAPIKDRASLYLVRIAQVLEAAGDVDEALAATREAIRVDPFYYPAYFWQGRILLGAGRDSEAEEVLVQLQETARQSLAPTGGFWIHLLRAERYLAERNPHAAAAEVEQVSALAPEHRNRPMEWLTRARVRAAMGDRSGAIAAYHAMSEPRNRIWQESQSPWQGVVVETRALYAMARLEEEAGDLTSARQHYREFLDRWGAADLPIAEVEEAKSRLAAIEDSSGREPS